MASRTFFPVRLWAVVSRRPAVVAAVAVVACVAALGAATLLLSPLAGAAGRASAAGGAINLVTPLIRGAGLAAPELQSAEAGAAVTKLLPAPNERDVAVFGMIRVHSSPDAILARLLDPARSLQAPGRRFGIIHDPTVAADAATVSFDESEYRELKNCRPGDCHFKLPAIAMQMFAKEINWSAPDAKAQVDRRLREGLVRVVESYRKRGDSEILVYDDRGGIRPHDVFAELAAQTAGWLEYPPELRRGLTSYPTRSLAGARDFLYWEEDRQSRLRPTLTLNHVVAYDPKSNAVYLAKKQVYASHYFEGGFELISIVDLRPAGEPGAFVLAVRDNRFDQLSGGVTNIRGKARKMFEQALQSDLERLKAGFEKDASR